MICGLPIVTTRVGVFFNDVPSNCYVELELEKLRIDLKAAEQNLDKVQEEKGYVDILRDILNDKGAKANIIRKYVPIMNQLINNIYRLWTSLFHLI